MIILVSVFIACTPEICYAAASLGSRLADPFPGSLRPEGAGDWIRKNIGDYSNGN